MKLSVVVAGAMLAAAAVVPTAAAHAAVTVTETYDYYGDAAHFQFTNNGPNAITNLVVNGGFGCCGTNTGATFLTVASGASVDYYLGDNESNFIGSQGSATASYMDNGQTYSGTFTDVLGDPDSEIGPVSIEGSFAPTGSVPEPSSWLMMVAGFGMLGFALRRKPVLRLKSATA